MMDGPENAICIGGPLDGKIIKTNIRPNDYTLNHISDTFEVVLYYYMFNDLSITQAMFKVFTAYGKKK